MQGFLISTCLFLGIIFRKGKTRAKHWGYGKLIIILWVLPFTSVSSKVPFVKRELRRIRHCSSISLNLYREGDPRIKKTEPCRSMKQKHVLYHKFWIHNLSQKFICSRWIICLVFAEKAADTRRIVNFYKHLCLFYSKPAQLWSLCFVWSKIACLKSFIHHLRKPVLTKRLAISSSGSRTNKSITYIYHSTFFFLTIKSFLFVSYFLSSGSRTSFQRPVREVA